MKAQTVTIIGLDRFGASIGRALKKSPLQLTIVGNDSDNERTRAAEAAGAIDSSKRNLASAAAAADILVLAVPFVELEETLRIVGDAVQEHTLVIDLSDLKGPGLTWGKQFMKQGHYVGASLVLSASSLADGRTDTELANADLFQNSVMCVMPAVDVEEGAVETAVNFGRLLGASPYFVDIAEYDNLVQGTETLPGLIAAATFGAVHKAGGWRDMLRFAGLPFALTTLPLANGENTAKLALNNKEATLRWLNALIEEMQQVRQWVYEGEAELLAARLESLMLERDRWLRERAKNDWLEVKEPDLGAASFTGHLFGGLTNIRGKKSE
ncbi:MAG: prephenate dehydrogenase [Ardenticatenaceae bacterium]|nr:prephenate dehydrogenase [Ardenticatenaceae bacterium]MCB9442753.1 prephenate dehydrogenase [Ardenticatenaceae bacterium]